MNIVIIGQGAIGLLWYHKLSQLEKVNVRLLCSAGDKKTPQFMRYSYNNHCHDTAIQIADKTSLAQADIILFCLKAYHLPQAFCDYLPDVALDTPIILCHNGMLIREQLPKDHIVLSLLTTHASKRVQPYCIEHTGLGTNDLGALSGALPQARAQQITQLFQAALPNTLWSDNIQQKQWLKLAVNCVINPLTALNNCDNGEILMPRFQPEITAILREFIQVAQANQQLFTMEELITLVLKVAKNTAANCSSMRSDILQGRKTEIDHINGFIAQSGQLYGINVEKNVEISAQINALEAHQ